jgi:tetratricopeptide (TPR) repeat protein
MLRFAKLIKKHKDNYNTGISLIELQPEEALKSFEEAVRIDPNFASAWGMKGKAFYNLGLYENVLLACKEALELDPNLVWVWVMKCSALYDLGRYKEALESLNEYEKKTGQKDMDDCNLSQFKDTIEGQCSADPNVIKYILLNKGRIRSVDEITTGYSHKLSWILGMKGKALYNLGQYEEALRCFKNALGLKLNTNTWIWGMTGNTLLKLGRDQEALEVCEEALKLDPKNTSILNCEANALLKLGRNQEALEVCEEALKLDPKNTSVLNCKGNALLNLRCYQDALEAYEQALSIDPNAAHILCNKGLSLLCLGPVYHKRASDCFAKNVNTFARISQGLLSILQGEFDNAQKIFENVAEFDLNSNVFTLALYKLGKGLLAYHQGKTEFASQLFAESQANVSQFAFYSHLKGICFMALKAASEEAEGSFEKVAELQDKTTAVQNSQSLRDDLPQQITCGQNNKSLLMGVFKPAGVQQPQKQMEELEQEKQELADKRAENSINEAKNNFSSYSLAI